MKSPSTSGRHRRLPWVGLVVLLLSGLHATPGWTLLSNSINGYVDVTAVQSESDGDSHETLRQEYTANWRKDLTTATTLRASIRYYKFDLDAPQAANAWREEYQPAGEMVWKHPAFVFSSSAQRRSTKARVSASNLITDNALLSLRSRDTRYPLVRLRYDWQHIFDTATGESRDTRDKRFQGSLDYSRGDVGVAYSFTRRMTDNVITGLESADSNHLARISAARTTWASGRVRVSTNYTYSRGSRTDQTTTDAIVDDVPIAVGLYAEDPSPEFDALDVVSALTDGNMSAPTLPEIDIGGASTDRNIGADLGFRRPVSTLYIHTDRTSGGGVTWRVYASNDNLTWQLWTATPATRFNAGLNRYEIDFATVDTRYVKVVNGGLNDVTEVFVTEIRAFQELSETRKTHRVRTAHLADLRAAWRASSRVNTSLDVSFQHLPAQGLVDSRSNADYAVRTRLVQTNVVSHHMRWEQSFQNFSRDSLDLMGNTASYTLLVEPLATLSGTVSLNSRHDYTGERKDQEVNSAVAQINGDPVPGLALTLEVVKTRSHQYGLGLRNDAWVTRASVDGSISRSLDAVANVSYQTTKSRPEWSTRIRRLYGIGFSYRLTRTIFARGNLSIVDDVSDNMRHEYLVGWNLTPKLAISAQAFFTDARNEIGTERYIMTANYEIGRRSSLYASVSHLDFAEAGGEVTTSYQQGFRTGF